MLYEVITYNHNQPHQEYMQAAKANGLITEKQAEASRKLEMQFISTSYNFV